jgi:hypothetical protein
VSFDNLSHVAVMGRVRARVKDKRVLALVKAFLKAGTFTEAGGYEDSGLCRCQCADVCHVCLGWLCRPQKSA